MCTQWNAGKKGGPRAVLDMCSAGTEEITRGLDLLHGPSRGYFFFVFSVAEMRRFDGAEERRRCVLSLSGGKKLCGPVWVMLGGGKKEMGRKLKS